MVSFWTKQKQHANVGNSNENVLPNFRILKSIYIESHMGELVETIVLMCPNLTTIAFKAYDYAIETVCVFEKFSFAAIANLQYLNTLKIDFGGSTNSYAHKLQFYLEGIKPILHKIGGQLLDLCLREVCCCVETITNYCKNLESLEVYRCYIIHNRDFQPRVGKTPPRYLKRLVLCEMIVDEYGECMPPDVLIQHLTLVGELIGACCSLEFLRCHLHVHKSIITGMLNLRCLRKIEVFSDANVNEIIEQIVLNNKDTLESIFLNRRNVEVPNKKLLSIIESAGFLCTSSTK